MTVNLEAVKAAQCVQKQLNPSVDVPESDHTVPKKHTRLPCSCTLQQTDVYEHLEPFIGNEACLWRRGRFGHLQEILKNEHMVILKRAESESWRQRGLSLWFSGWNVSNAPSWDQERRRGMKGWREECSNKTIRDRKWPWLQQDVESAAMMSSLASPAKHECKHTHTLCLSSTS